MTRRTPSTGSSGSSSGFTLIEVTIALTLLSIVLVGLQSLLISSIRADATATGITAATTLAQQKIELLRNTPYANVSLTSGTSETVAPYTRTLLVAAGPAANTKNVVVSVSWLTPTGTNMIQLNTLLAQ